VSELKWGSEEWRTHLRRSLAQRKRHGENITDIEGLIDYIEAKGPTKGGNEVKKRITDNKPQPRQQRAKTSKITNASGRKIVQAPVGQTVPDEGGLFKAPVVLRGR
jgi:hypothetical protein